MGTGLLDERVDLDMAMERERRSSAELYLLRSIEFIELLWVSNFSDETKQATKATIT